MKKFLIKVNGNRYEVEVEEIMDSGTISESETTKTVPAAKAPAKLPVAGIPDKKEAIAPEGVLTVKAPMPGTVLKVSANSGDSVKKGQVLLVLEAMKMENEITSPKDGIVASVNVSKGSAVNAGDVLVSLK